MAPASGVPAQRLPRASTDSSPCARLQRSPSDLVVSRVVGVSTTDVSASPSGELFSETNDNSVAILLSYGTARILLAGRGEGEEYMASSLHEPLSGRQGLEVQKILSCARPVEQGRLPAGRTSKGLESTIIRFEGGNREADYRGLKGRKYAP